MAQEWLTSIKFCVIITTVLTDWKTAIVIRNGSVAGALTSGGTAWKIVSENGALKKTAVTLLK